MQDAKTASVHVRLCSLVRWRQQECNYVYGGHLRPFDALALHGVCVALRGGGRAGAEQVGEVKSVERRFGKKKSTGAPPHHRMRPQLVWGANTKTNRPIGGSHMLLNSTTALYT